MARKRRGGSPPPAAPPPTAPDVTDDSGSEVDSQAGLTSSSSESDVSGSRVRRRRAAGGRGGGAGGGSVDEGADTDAEADTEGSSGSIDEDSPWESDEEAVDAPGFFGNEGDVELLVSSDEEAAVATATGRPPSPTGAAAADTAADVAAAAAAVVSDAATPDAGTTAPPAAVSARRVHTAVLSDDERGGPLPAAEDPPPESGSSSEEERNPVGNIPMHWYDGFDHIGYARDGTRLARGPRRSLVERAADPRSWRTVWDEKNGVELTLTGKELAAIARLRAGRHMAGPGAPGTGEVVAWAGDVETLHPLPSGTVPKRRFRPSAHEARRVVQLVRAMRAGLISTSRKPLARGEAAAAAALAAAAYEVDLWAASEADGGDDGDFLGRPSQATRDRSSAALAAPKVPLPGHAASYRPPPEYLPSAQAAREWTAARPIDRRMPFLPTSHDALRHVPNYAGGIKERFERCLDLYLAVRVRARPVVTDVAGLVPVLPSPRELRPYPNGGVATLGDGSAGRVRSLHVHPRGLWLASGGDDGCVRVWEVATGRCRAVYALGGSGSGAAKAKKATHEKGDASGKSDSDDDNDNEVVPTGPAPVVVVRWCPRGEAAVFAAAVGRRVVIVSAATALGVSPADDAVVFARMSDRDSGGPSGGDGPGGPSVAAPASAAMTLTWADTSLRASGTTRRVPPSPVITIGSGRPLRALTWHRHGDYLGSLASDASGTTLAIHRLSRRASQTPLRRGTSGLTTIAFHPTRPLLLVGSQHQVRLYHLGRGVLVKRLQPGVKHIACLAVHPSGDHVLVGSYDRRTVWIDLDLSVRPYKVLRGHQLAVRSLSIHPALPLFADGGDEGGVHVWHGRVYDDLEKNALIVPLKRMQGHTTTTSLGVMDLAWHPRLPWLFSAGADGVIRMYVDVE